MPRVRMIEEKVETTNGSSEQAAIWNELDEGARNLIIDAVAGSGKTYTIVEWAKKQKAGRIGLVAFNKHIAVELKDRLGDSACEAMTYHSLGLKLVRQAVGRVTVDNHKVESLLEDIDIGILDEWEEKKAKWKIGGLVGLAKQYCAHGREELEEIVEHHDVDLNGREELVYDWTPKILDMCKKNLSTVDFDDMVWLPGELGLSLQGGKYDVLMVDELQDTNLAQQWIALNTARRLVGVGDRNQAIYGFRGSDHRSMKRIEGELGSWRNGVVNLPLTVTRRCPTRHVELAQRIVPHIRPLEGAAEGLIETVNRDHAIDSMAPGDLVLCRVNAELLGTAYKLLRMGKKAIVRGRDIGKGLTKLIDKALKAGAGEDLNSVLRYAGEITDKEIRKFKEIPKGRGEMRAANAQDRFECLLELSAGADTANEMKGVIERLFADFDENGKPKDAIVLGTVHRTKGLESERVWVLRPDLIPHPMARKGWQYEQELNLAYVSVTRSKRELYWVGGECGLFT